jgi:hypothetical protein
MTEKQVKRCLKSGPIYHPAQYITLMKTAKKKGSPYKVHELSHEDFKDIKDLWDNIGCNTTVNEEGKLSFQYLITGKIGFSTFIFDF